MDASHQETLLLRQAVQLATDNVRNSGGPFGALVVSQDGRVFEGVNRVTANLDPTAHAEVTAIRAACQALGTFDLTGATLYASCEPCPMCLSSALWARIGTVFFAADRHDAAGAGFDDAVFYDYFENPGGEESIMPIRRIGLSDEDATEPFSVWLSTPDRIAY
jgi:guanine deaminase